MHIRAAFGNGQADADVPNSVRTWKWFAKYLANGFRYARAIVGYSNLDGALIFAKLDLNLSRRRARAYCLTCIEQEVIDGSAEFYGVDADFENRMVGKRKLRVPRIGMYADHLHNVSDDLIERVLLEIVSMAGIGGQQEGVKDVD